MERLTVGKLAERAGTSADTIRYYDRIGLLSEPARTAAGYRMYDETVAEELAFIRHAQRFGLRLSDIGELLRARREGLCPCGHARTLLEGRLGELDRELTALGRLRDEVARILDESPSDASGWACAGAPVQIQSRRPGTEESHE